MKYSPKLAIDTLEYGDPFDQLQEGIEWLLQRTKREGLGASIRGIFDVSSTTRFAVNQVTQHTDLTEIRFDIRLVKGKQTATASTSLLGAAALENLFDTALSGLKSSPPIDFYQGLPSQKDISTKRLTGMAWSVEERVDAVILSVNSALELDENLRTAGTASEVVNYMHLVSTEGTDIETSSNRNYFKINAIAGDPDQRGYGQEQLFWRFHEPDYEKMGQQSARVALDTIKLIDLPAKNYEVLLSPQAVSNLMVFLLFTTNGTTFHESTSYASDRLGDQILDSKITIKDSPLDPENATIVYTTDFEGMPAQNQTLFQNGTLKFIPYDSFEASKYLDDKNLATGNQLQGFQGTMALPFSSVIEPGQRSLQEQIGEVEDGLLVNEFWYNRFTIRREGGLTGLTRNGLFHIKMGEIQGAVRNLRYTESFVNAFGPDNVISVGSERTKFQLINCPSLHLKDYRFSSVAHSFD
ncbi:MAG: TldD/PmbA family protein [Candidatus Heimdallarchaeota archaeon]|nr:TldD/PmbA family protein [Candidatus Heimdallarchaeota archaeon]